MFTNGEIRWIQGTKSYDWISLSGIAFAVAGADEEPLALENGWQADNNYGTPTVHLGGSVCSVQGLVKSGGWGLIATLPSGCRPSKRLIFNVANHANSARVDVLTNGRIEWMAGGQSPHWLSLSGIRFAPAGGYQETLALENGWHGDESDCVCNGKSK